MHVSINTVDVHVSINTVESLATDPRGRTTGANTVGIRYEMSHRGTPSRQWPSSAINAGGIVISTNLDLETCLGLLQLLLQTAALR